jgi:hypothetical protein
LQALEEQWKREADPSPIKLPDENPALVDTSSAALSDAKQRTRLSCPDLQAPTNCEVINGCFKMLSVVTSYAAMDYPSQSFSINDFKINLISYSCLFVSSR